MRWIHPSQAFNASHYSLDFSLPVFRASKVGGRWDAPVPVQHPFVCVVGRGGDVGVLGAARPALPVPALTAPASALVPC